MDDRRLTETHAWLGREAAAMGGVHKIRFYPFVLERAEGVRVWDVDGNEYLDMIAAGGVLQTGSGHPRGPSGHPRRARPLLVHDALHVSGAADDRARGASLRDVPRRRCPRGVVRHQRVRCQRLSGQAAAGGDRAPTAHQLRRRLPRPDGRLGCALRPLDSGADHRRRQHHQGSLSLLLSLSVGVRGAGRLLTAVPDLSRGLRACQRLSGRRYRRDPAGGDAVRRGRRARPAAVPARAPRAV